MKKLQKKQSENCELLGKKFDINSHVCVWPDGRPLLPNYISQKFAQILARKNLSKIRFHDLRHTAGSLLLNNGLSIKQIQNFLGHEQVSTTLDIYTHLSTEGKKQTAHVMGELLGTGSL